MKPQLQLAIDAPEHFSLLPIIGRYFDIIEIGTPVLKRFGTSAISTAHELGGGLPILADTKTVDGGGFEAEMVFSAGAAMMTTLVNASPATRNSVKQTAKAYGATVIFDTILDDRVNREDLALLPTEEIWLALHHGFDARTAGSEDRSHIDAVARRRSEGFRVSLAGGIGRANLTDVLKNPPDIIVIGSSVTGADDPKKEALWIAQQIG